VNPSLPRSAPLAAWLAAWLRGEVAADDLLGHVDAGRDPVVHVVTGVADGALPLALSLGALRAAGSTGASVALPAPGDPVGLGGPAALTTAALEAGEAVLLEGAGLALVPATVGGAVEWRSMAADPAPYVDAGEASVTLRQTLLDVTGRLVDLDVATWQPEIPDALMNLRHRPPLALPPSYDARRRELLERAALCLDIVRLARETPSGALTATDIAARDRALADLDRAARRAVVAGVR
jgi:hypothetical protein